MNVLSNSRREMLKQAGLGLGLATTAPWAGAAVLMPSKVETGNPPENYVSLPVLAEVDSPSNGHIFSTDKTLEYLA